MDAELLWSGWGPYTVPDHVAVHLPSFLTNILVYTRMKEDLECSGRQVICQSHFYNLWAAEFPHVSIPKVAMTCRECIG